MKKTLAGLLLIFSTAAFSQSDDDIYHSPKNDLQSDSSNTKEVEVIYNDVYTPANTYTPPPHRIDLRPVVDGLLFVLPRVLDLTFFILDITSDINYTPVKTNRPSKHYGPR